jgi:carbamoyl-phosphate synthase large subunit
MNILFTSAGRRGYLLDWFRESGRYGAVVAINSEPCPAFAHSDAWQLVPTSASPAFEESLFALIQKYSINVIFALSDVDAFVLSRIKDLLLDLGVTFVGPDHKSVKLMLDKFKWSQILEKNGFPSVRTINDLGEVTTLLESGKMSFPLMLKSRVGTSSLSNRVARNNLELQIEYKALSDHGSLSFLEASLGIRENNKVIFQELLVGVEFGVDILCDLGGAYEGYLSRRKVRMRSGETDQAQTIPKLELDFSMESLSTTLGVIGLVDLDIMIMSNDTSAILDINPRIGGGYPFSHFAGADFPEYVYKWLRGERLNFDFNSIRKLEAAKSTTIVEIPTQTEF